MASKQILEDPGKPVFDQILENKVKFGYYQNILYILIGFVMLADGSEMTALSILLPVLKSEWGISQEQQGLLGAALFVGVFIGSILSGFVADKFGRRNTLMYTSAIQFLMGIISAYVNSVEVFIVMRGIFGMMIGCTIPIAPTMVSELTPTEYRGKGIVVINFFFTLGKIYSVLCGKLTLTSLTEGDWRLMLILSSIPSIVVSVGTWKFIKESPRFLIVTGRVDEGVQAINEIGILNNEEVFQKVTNEEKNKLVNWQQRYFNTKDVSSFTSLWGLNYRLITLCLWIIWFLMQFIELGIIFILPYVINAIYQEENLDATRGLNDMILTTIGEAPSIIFSFLIIERVSFGRKNSLILCMGLATLFFALMAALPLSSFIILITAVRLAQKVGYSMLYPLTTELYPTTMRITGFSFASAFGRLGAACMPHVTLLLFSIEPIYPIFGFGVASCLILLTVFLVPYDTTGIELDRMDQKFIEFQDTK